MEQTQLYITRSVLAFLSMFESYIRSCHYTQRANMQQNGGLSAHTGVGRTTESTDAVYLRTWAARADRRGSGRSGGSLTTATIIMIIICRAGWY